jgi:hypothetical protein
MGTMLITLKCEAVAKGSSRGLLRCTSSVYGPKLRSRDFRFRAAVEGQEDIQRTGRNDATGPSGHAPIRGCNGPMTIGGRMLEGRIWNLMQPSEQIP